MNYRKHKENWIDCQRCDLCECRTRVVLVRGQLPAPLLFIGEAPGESEDTLGKPFIGPAGKLLDDILQAAGVEAFAITNLIGCIPRDEEHQKIIVPPAHAVKACAPRLQELLGLCKPLGVVWVGKEAAKWGPKLLGWKGPTAELVHPAAILRASPAQQGLAVQKSVVTISDFKEELE